MSGGRREEQGLEKLALIALEFLIWPDAPTRHQKPSARLMGVISYAYCWASPACQLHTRQGASLKNRFQGALLRDKLGKMVVWRPFGNWCIEKPYFFKKCNFPSLRLWRINWKNLGEKWGPRVSKAIKVLLCIHVAVMNFHRVAKFRWMQISWRFISSAPLLLRCTRWCKEERKGNTSSFFPFFSLPSCICSFTNSSHVLS